MWLKHHVVYLKILTQVCNCTFVIVVCLELYKTSCPGRPVSR